VTSVVQFVILLISMETRIFCILFVPSIFPLVFSLDLRIPLRVRACRILAVPKNSLLAILDFLQPVGFYDFVFPNLRQSFEFQRSFSSHVVLSITQSAPRSTPRSVSFSRLVVLLFHFLPP
jgi:hypothetical protein